MVSLDHFQRMPPHMLTTRFVVSAVQIDITVACGRSAQECKQSCAHATARTRIKTSPLSSRRAAQSSSPPPQAPIALHPTFENCCCALQWAQDLRTSLQLGVFTNCLLASHPPSKLRPEIEMERVNSRLHFRNCNVVKRFSFLLASATRDLLLLGGPCTSPAETATKR